MTIAQVLAGAAARGVERLDAQLLLLHVLGRAQDERAWLVAHDTDVVRESEQDAFFALCARRVEGEPLAYLVGQKEFHGLMLQVDRRVLVPRPDTETLVDWALELLPARGAGRVIDLGTGSGAIALAIKHRRPHARVEAVDASEEALQVARANASRLALDIAFRHASWLDGSHGPYDLIVSNPPYIREDDEHLAALHREPLGALASGADGLRDIRSIIAAAPAALKPGGWLLLEHGWDQADAVRGLLSRAGLHETQSRADLAGIARCSGACLPNS